jgi:MHS family proline/betaine transporter-like MFS transporter
MINKSIFAAITGAVFECYNSALYGFLAVSLAPLFFPDLTNFYKSLASYSAFAAGFILRPLGGALFGHIGDKWGRKTSLKITALLTAIPALIISITPTHQTIGLLAPIVLFSCRLIQGISVGSDYIGAVIVIFEQNNHKNKSIITSLLVALGFFGSAIGVGIAVLSTLPFMPLWGWRIPFMIGGLASLFAFYLRFNMKETAAYLNAKKEKRITKSPLKNFLKGNIKLFITCCIFGGMELIPIFLATVYMNFEFRNLLSFSTTDILINNFILLLLSVMMVLLAKKIISKYGEILIIKICMYWYVLFSIPLYFWAFNKPSTCSLFLLQLFIMAGDIPQFVALISLMPKFFPTEWRYSAMGLSFSIGHALIGGMTPIFASLLVVMTNQTWAPGYLLFISSLIYLATLYYAKNHFIKPNSIIV